MVIASDVIRRVVEVFATRPDLAAVFGSYDARPRAEGIVSQYRNLLHHFVHQTGNPIDSYSRSSFDSMGSSSPPFVSRSTFSTIYAVASAMCAFGSLSSFKLLRWTRPRLPKENNAWSGGWEQIISLQ